MNNLWKERTTSGVEGKRFAHHSDMQLKVQNYPWRIYSVLRANVVNVTQLSNRSAAATFAGAGAVTLVVNGTDDRVDDGDVTYPVFVDTCVGFDLPSDGSYL